MKHNLYAKMCFLRHCEDGFFVIVCFWWFRVEPNEEPHQNNKEHGM